MSTNSQQTLVGRHCALPGLIRPANKSCPLHHQLGTARSSLACQQELSPPQPTWNCHVFFGLPTRAVPSTTNLELTARSSSACQQELSPPQPTWNCQVFFGLSTRAVPSTTNLELPGLLWPANKSCPLHNQLGTARSYLACQQELSPPQPTWNCQVFFGLSTSAVPSTTNLELPGLLWPVNKSCPLHNQLGTARSSLACQQELSPPQPTWNCQVFFGLPTRAVPSTTNLELPCLLWPVNKSCPLHNQLGTARSTLACQQDLSPPPPTWNCQVFFGLPTRAVPSTTNLELPGLLWPANKSCPLHNQLGTARSSLACQQELSPPQPTWNCQVFFGLSTRAVPSTTNLELPGLLWPANKSCPLHNQLGTARSSLACQQELSPPQPTWNCQVFFGLPTRAVPSTTNLKVGTSCLYHNLSIGNGNAFWRTMMHNTH